MAHISWDDDGGSNIYAVRKDGIAERQSRLGAKRGKLKTWIRTKIFVAGSARRYCERRIESSCDFLRTKKSGRRENLHDRFLLSDRFVLVGIEHPLNLIGIRRLRKRQRKQQPRLPGLQIVAGDETASL